MRPWRIWAIAAVGHPPRTCPSRSTHRGHRHPLPPMVMAGCEDRECDQNQRGNQAASPPTILFQCLLLKTVETRFEALLRCFLLISSASCFLRHERLPLFFYCRGAISERSVSLPTCIRNRARALIMPHQKQRRSATADVTYGEAGALRLLRLPATTGGPANRDDKLWIERAHDLGRRCMVVPGAEPAPSLIAGADSLSYPAKDPSGREPRSARAFFKALPHTRGAWH